MTDFDNNVSALKSISTCPDQEALSGTLHQHQKPLFGRMLIAVGMFIRLIGALEALILTPLGTSEAESYFLILPRFLQDVITTIPEGTPVLLLALPGALMFVAGQAVVKFGRRHLAHAYEANEAHVFKAPILYLRSFVADKSPSQFVQELSITPFMPMSFFGKRARAWHRLMLIESVSRYEELLAYAFRQVGNLVAIGNPKEGLPLLGATRIYAEMPRAAGSIDEETWQVEVERLIAGAQLVLLQIGRSEGLGWEVRRLVQVADPERVVLCIHPSRKAKYSFKNLYYNALRTEIKELWSQFRMSFEGVFPRGLPEVIDDARFIKFDSNWGAIPVQTPKLKLVWFIPGLNPDLSRKTIDSALTWLTWMMVPEGFGRMLLRNFINYVTFILSIIALSVLFFFIVSR